MRGFEGDGWVPGTGHKFPGHDAQQHEQIEQHPDLTRSQSPAGLLCSRSHAYPRSIAARAGRGKRIPQMDPVRPAVLRADSR